MKPQRSNLKNISRWKTDARKVRRAHEREAWPKNIRERAIRLMISGARAGELAKGAGVAEHTLHQWRQDSSERIRRGPARRSRRGRKRWLKLKVVDRARPEAAVPGLRVVLASGAELTGATLEQVELLIRRGVL